MTESEPAGLLPIELFVLLVVVATVVAFIARRSALPYTVALVLAGLAIAFLFPTAQVGVTPELLLAVLLPGLVFEASYKIDLRELRRTFGAVAILAAPGVLITASLVAVLVSSWTSLGLSSAFLLGAMVCATDPVAVVSLFKRLRAPSRLATVVEAESLLNDGTGVVLFAIALRAISEPVTLAEGVVVFVVTVMVSTVIGLVAGWVAERLMVLADDHLIEVAISVIAAYGTYLVADRLHESGIIATVVVGLVLGNAGGAERLRQRTREALDITWEFVAFLLTALTFLLMGLAISPDLLVTAAPIIAAGFVAITFARAFVVYVVIGGGDRLLPMPTVLPLGYLHVMFWAGLRGAIAVALALALPESVPDRDLLTGGVFGVVLVTLLVQGTTAGLVIRRAGVLPTTGAAKLDWPFDAGDP
jgi:CPA1 family monovalent cation:H+ antiporter